MKSFIRLALALVLLLPFFAHAAISAGGQLGDSCEVLPCDTAHGYTCNSVTKVCDYTGVPAPATPPGGSTGPSGSLNNPNNIFSGAACTPACDTAHGYVCQNGTCVPNNLQQSLDKNANPDLSPGFVPLAPIPGLTADQNGNAFIGTPDLPTFLDNLYKYAIGLAAAVAVVIIVWGGLEMSVQESVTLKLEGKQRVYNALFGLVLVLLPALVFGIINPSILNLSLNIPSLDIHPGKYAGVATQNFSCQGSDCTIAVQQCKAQMTANSVRATLVCLKSDGSTLSPTNGNVVNEVKCTNSSYTPTVQCSGTPNSGGSGQAGLSSNDTANGAIPLFDGNYMDLVKYTGSVASDQAHRYTCQSDSEGPVEVFSGLKDASGNLYWYALCVTPDISYVNVNVDGAGAKPDPATGTAATKYYGECQNVRSALDGEGFTEANLVAREGVNPSPITCSAQDKALGNSVSCFKVMATCTIQG